MNTAVATAPLAATASARGRGFWARLWHEKKLGAIGALALLLLSLIHISEPTRPY